MNTVTYKVEKIEDLKGVAQSIIEKSSCSLFLFIGDLGAGKTTLIKELIKVLGSEDEGKSPSFSIINQYKNENLIINHIDLYRLENAKEAFALGLEDIIYSDHPCFIEWPQLVIEYIDSPYHLVRIDFDENNHRNITVTKEN